ncbi:MAG TPA: hypothetical protein VL523_06180 [Terriglobia bacterium]|nr:hypothetical protein [Terriglobia bacterium]
MFVIETLLILAALGAALTCPGLGSRVFAACERTVGKLAERKRLAVLVVGLTALGLRAALLPIEPIPTPVCPDEFSQLLAADTFLHGRLANPPHPMWPHFENIAAIGYPTYSSYFPPAPSAFMAAGRLVAGHAFWGVWLSVGLMCAALCWMLQGWLPPGWALLGGFLAVLRLAAFTYWDNSYYGGAVAAMGGALVLGALPRIRHSWCAGDAVWMGVGLLLLINSRPYESLFFALPVAVALGLWALKGPHPPWPVLARRVVAPLAFVLLLAAAQTGYYNWRITGSPWVLPHDVFNARRMVPNFIWQHLRLDRTYYSSFARNYYIAWDLPRFLAARSPLGFLGNMLEKLFKIWFFYFGPLFTFPLLAAVLLLPKGFSWRHVSAATKFLFAVGAVTFVGLQLDVFFMPHYAAPLTGVILAFVLIALRRVRAWQWRGKPSGLLLSRAFAAIAVVMLALRAAAAPLHIPLPDPTSLIMWSERPPDFGRVRILKQLEATPGRHLVLARYGPRHNIYIDYMYNEADIDASKVVWARDLGPAENEELLRYYKDRTVWLLDADAEPPRLSLYRDAK